MGKGNVHRHGKKGQQHPDRAVGGWQPLKPDKISKEELLSRPIERVTLKIYTEVPLPGLREADDNFQYQGPFEGHELLKEYANITVSGLLEELTKKGLLYLGGKYLLNEKGVINYLRFRRNDGTDFRTRLFPTVLRQTLENLQFRRLDIFAHPYPENGRRDLIKLFGGHEDGPLHQIRATKKSWQIEPIVHH